MKEQKKIYVDAAVFFERLADDGWPEDAGLWPFDGFISPPVKCSHECVQRVRRLFRSQFIKCLLRNRNRMYSSSLG
jgi:hypothetical protein